MQPIPLDGRHVRLELFDETLREPVRAALDCDADAWRLFAINGQGAGFDGFWRSLKGQVAQGSPRDRRHRRHHQLPQPQAYAPDRGNRRHVHPSGRAVNPRQRGSEIPDACPRVRQRRLGMHSLETS
jgi:hypothetical protein